MGAGQLGLHLRIIGQPGPIGALKKLMARVAGLLQVRVASRLQSAKHFTRVSLR
jgi:hypothetical protein